MTTQLHEHIQIYTCCYVVMVVFFMVKAKTVKGNEILFLSKESYTGAPEYANSLP